MYRKSYVKINKKILENNVKEIVSKYDYQYYIGIVKNDAYHHGIEIIDELIKAGVNYLAVSSLDEAMVIRKKNKTIPILVLEPIDIDCVKDAVENNITLTVDNLSYVQKIKNYSVKIHLKIDSGMNRLGFKDKEEINETIKFIHEHHSLILEGIYTHLATSGVRDKYYDKQIDNFLYLVSDIDLNSIPIVHIDRSLTMVCHHKKSFVNGVRLGIVMYGFNGSISLNGKLKNLKRNIYLKIHHISNSLLTNDLNVNVAFSLYSTVLSVRKVSKGEFVGYGASYKVKDNAYVATIAIGYADGVTKEFKNVWINDKKYPIIADSMDMLMVLVDEFVNYQDIVEIIGSHIPVKEVTKALNVNAYHLFNSISNRVPRIYVER